MIMFILNACLTALVAGIIIGITVTLLAIIVYIVAGIITSLRDAFKLAQAKNRINKVSKSLQCSDMQRDHERGIDLPNDHDITGGTV